LRFILNVPEEGRHPDMTTVTVKGLNVLAVYVTDLARSEAFYREHLGFEKCQDMEPGILMKAGEVTLYLEACRQEPRGKGLRTVEFSPCFATDSVKGAYRALKAAGVPISVEYQEFAPTFAFFRISDPDGNLIEFAGKP
jgi:catechol 2,3-dioxygenase-like lactoylglutathione lyase family enzyme